MAAAYDRTALNSVNRKKQRGVYDAQTVHAIIDTTPVLHVAFNPDQADPNEDAFPAILPMLGVTGAYTPGADADSDVAAADADPARPRAIYLHGYVSARMMQLDAGGRGAPVTVAATLLDGIVLALTPFNHSCNYRSAVAFGYAKPVTDDAEKLWAMRRVTDNLVAHRWANTRLPNAAELTSTGILRVEIHSASAKVHVGGPANDRKDTQDPAVAERVWTGFVPTWMSYGPLMESVDNQVEQVPGYLREWTMKEGNARRNEAFHSVVDDKGVRGVK